MNRGKLRRGGFAGVLIAMVLAGLPGDSGAAVPAAPAGHRHWVTVAGYMMNSVPLRLPRVPYPPYIPSGTMSASTARMIVPVPVDGRAVRVKISNLDGRTPLTIEAAAVGLQDEGPALVPGSNVPLTFGGEPGLSVDPGRIEVSDPAPLRVSAGQSLGVSLFVPLPSPVDAAPAAGETSYLTQLGAGDQVADEGGSAFTQSTTSMYMVSAVDVSTAIQNGTVLAFGASVTAGGNASSDRKNYVSVLGRRLQSELPAGQRKTIVNAGIGGDTAIGSVQRLERDVLNSTVTHILIQNGQNDLGGAYTAEEVIAAYDTIIDTAHARGVRVIVGTINPRDSFNETQNRYRRQVNRWIREGGNCGGRCDGTIDFDRAIRDPNNRNVQDPEYRTDGIHPNDAGHASMANIADLDIFRGHGRIGAGRTSSMVI